MVHFNAVRKSAAFAMAFILALSLPCLAVDPGACSTIHLKYQAFSPANGEPDMPATLMASMDNPVRLVQVTGPLTSEEILSLEDAGATLLGYMQQNTYIAQVPGSALKSLEALPVVVWTGHYHPAYKIQAGLLQRTEDQIEVNMVIFRALDDEARRKEIHDAVNSLGGEISFEDPYSMAIRALVSPTAIPGLAALPQVSWIDRYDPPVTNMNNIRNTTGANIALSGGFNGSGITGEVKDNGIDQGHPDFGNLVGTYGGPVVDSHGTCTFGIVFGDGSGSSNATGMMPNGSGVFCDWYVSRGGSLNNLTNTWGGVFQSNSWSQGWTDSSYDSYSQEDDQAIVDYDAMMFYSASNSNYGVGAETCSVDAAAKNTVAVGAVFHQNTATLSDDQWENHGSGSTPGQGPAADGRIKPDLCGFFDWIYCTDRTGSAGYSSTNYYDDFGGTSGACPIVAGAAGLTYEMYESNHFGNNPGHGTPHSATIKAMLIANAYQYSFSDATRYQQGWGLVDVGRIHDAGTSMFIQDGGNPLSTGQSWSTAVARYSVSEPMKISLVWNDEPGESSSSKALINDLDLTVTSPGGTVYRGNVGLVSNLYSTSGGSSDRLNNVENVFIQSPQSGTWTIQVSAYNVAQDNDPAAGVNQDFSVVASMVYGSCLDDIYEPNNTFGTASTPFGGTIPGLQICDSDEDYFRLYAEAGNNIQVDIDFIDADGDLSLYLYSPSQALLDSSTSSTDGETVSASAVSATGYFFARVIGVGAVENTYELTTTVAGMGQTMHTEIGCIPASGVLPYMVQLWPQLCNDNNITRRLAGHIDINIGNGTDYINWRAGFTNVIAGNCYTNVIGVNLPALGALVGVNTFTIVGEDVTAAPYNQPPFSPSGDTDISFCTSTASN